MAVFKLKSLANESRLSRGGKSIVTFNYWTNFNKRRSVLGDYEVLDKEADMYWWFQTNLTPADIENMDRQALNRFLFQMQEHYGPREKQKDA